MAQNMPKEELAASGSGHLTLTDFDDDDKDENEEGAMIGDMSGGGRRRMFMKELRCTLYGKCDRK